MRTSLYMSSWAEKDTKIQNKKIKLSRQKNKKKLKKFIKFICFDIPLIITEERCMQIVWTEPIQRSEECVKKRQNRALEYTHRMYIVHLISL